MLSCLQEERFQLGKWTRPRVKGLKSLRSVVFNRDDRRNRSYRRDDHLKR